MDPQRQGEIALKLVKHVFQKRGFRFSHDEMREMGNVAKNIDISLEELKEFMMPFAQEAFDECFGTKK